MKGIGHFGRVSAFVPGTDRQFYTTTGQVIGAPNATSGMHARVSGLGGEMFGPTQTNWITGIQNEYVVAGVGLLLVVMMMK